MIMNINTDTGSKRKLNRGVLPTIIAVTAIVMAGCASAPPPTEQLAVSRVAVTSAARDGGNEYAPVELKAATDKMQGAEKAMAAKEYSLARQLAEEAQLDAKLAETKTALGKTQKSINDSQESNRVLREEINRTTQ